MVLTRSGEVILNRMLAPEFAQFADVQILDVTVEGHSSVVASLRLGDGFSRPKPYLVWFDLSSGNLVNVMCTEPTACIELAGQGTGFWCLATDSDDPRGWVKNSDVALRFSSSGEILASALPRRELSDILYGVPSLGSAQVVAGDGGFAIWPVHHDRLWSFQADGGWPRCVLASRPIDEGHEAFGEIAILPGMQLVAYLDFLWSVEQRKLAGRRLAFVKENGTLEPDVQFPSDPHYVLVGVDGSELVLLDAVRNVLLWFDSPAPSPATIR